MAVVTSPLHQHADPVSTAIGSEEPPVDLPGEGLVAAFRIQYDGKLHLVSVEEAAGGDPAPPGVLGGY